MKNRKIIAIAGQPGTGKTSLMWKFIEKYDWETVEPKKSLPCLYSKELDLYILGKYEKGEVFAGSDRYSMSIQPTATEFVKETTSNIILEGDRLTNNKFYDMLLGLPDTEVRFIVLKTTKAILEERYKERGSNQSETFLKGRKTKIDNILGNFEYMDYVEVFENKDFEDQERILESLNVLLFSEKR